MVETITIKDDYTFLLSSLTGDLLNGLEGYGLYFQDTRYLSELILTIDGKPLQLLSQNTDYNLTSTFRMSSSYVAQIHTDDVVLAPAMKTIDHSIGISRQRYIDQGLIENLVITNFHTSPVKIKLGLRLSSDFADIFEVRGFDHSVSGEISKIVLGDTSQVIDLLSIPPSRKSPVTRRLRFQTTLPASDIEFQHTLSPLYKLDVPVLVLNYDLELFPQSPFEINMSFIPSNVSQDISQQSESVVMNSSFPHSQNFEAGISKARAVLENWKQECTNYLTDNYNLNQILQSSILDLRSLMQQESQGLAITAGLPWYFTLFGRDSLITSIQTLTLNPQIAVDTLKVLAAYQADEYNDLQDSEPGKILHELRRGDMTLSGQTPHRPYFGSVDSTVLFILCFAKTLEWIDDPVFFANLWPAVEKALQWCYKYGDLDGDGYIEFKRRSKEGILHQGWKDSNESLGGYLGPHPAQPLALVEVQGYLYDAKLSLSKVLSRYGDEKQQKLSEALKQEAEQLKLNFNRDFWWEEEGFFVQALDAYKNPVRQVSSNPGHCLWSGIVDQSKAQKVVKRIMQPDLLCGWGVRTLSALDPNYNPMSYHNGSIWPHDNSLLAAGLRRYGFLDELKIISTQIFDAAATFKDFRLPELYCGFERAGSEVRAPAAYPVSCSPQAWAAGTSIFLMQALLGLEKDNITNLKSVASIMPEEINTIALKGIRLGHLPQNLFFDRDPINKDIKLRGQNEEIPIG